MLIIKKYLQIKEAHKYYILRATTYLGIQIQNLDTQKSEKRKKLRPNASEL